MPFMTPLEYANKYWNLEVPFEDGPVTVRVSRYLVGSHSSPWVSGVKQHVGECKPLVVKVKTVHGAVLRPFYSAAKLEELKGVMKDPFNGKGSPEEIQVLLQVAVKCGFLKKTEVKDFCTSGKIGLDCCGFTSNYTWHALMGKPWDLDITDKDVAASWWIPTVMKAGRKIKTEEEFVSCRAQPLLLATVNEAGHVIQNGAKGAHIMITEPNSLIHMKSTTTLASKKGKESITWNRETVPVTTRTTERNTVTVVESTGTIGLVSSRYSILDVNEKTGVFRMQRGCKNGTLRVAVATLAV